MRAWSSEVQPTRQRKWVGEEEEPRPEEGSGFLKLGKLDGRGECRLLGQKIFYN